MRSVATAHARKHAAPSAVFQFAAARFSSDAGRGNEVAGDRRDPEEDAAKQVDRRLPPARMAARGQPAVPRRGAVGDRARDQEADRAERVRAPHEPVVVGVGQGCVQRLIGRHVEEQRAGGLDDGGPPRRPAGGAGMALGERDERLQRPADGEQDRADEERDRVGGWRRRAARSRGTGRSGSTPSRARRTGPSSARDSLPGSPARLEWCCSSEGGGNSPLSARRSASITLRAACCGRSPRPRPRAPILRRREVDVSSAHPSALAECLPMTWADH